MENGLQDTITHNWLPLDFCPRVLYYFLLAFPYYSRGSLFIPIQVISKSIEKQRKWTKEEETGVNLRQRIKVCASFTSSKFSCQMAVKMEGNTFFHLYCHCLIKTQPGLQLGTFNYPTLYFTGEPGLSRMLLIFQGSPL